MFMDRKPQYCESIRVTLAIPGLTTSGSLLQDACSHGGSLFISQNHRDDLNFHKNNTSHTAHFHN
jgi:hypothetical protein